MADFEYITNQGVIVPDTADIRQAVEAEWRAAYGQDLVVTPESPQGLMITTQIETRDGVARNNAELANQINPDIAGGVFLDALWRLTGGKRRAATRSVVNGVIFGGVPNTIIPAGSLATVGPTGAVFLTVEPLQIGPDGTVSGSLRAQEVGPILAAPGALNALGSSVLGWETIVNPTAAVPGRLAESDVASRTRRRVTLAEQTISVAEAIISALYGLDSVRSLAYRENWTSATEVIDGITLVEHSIWVCVEGGTDAEIAEVLVREKTAGAGYNGTQSVAYVDPFSGQSYDVLFDRPDEIPVFARFTVAPTTLDAQTLIPDIIQDYIAGEIEGGMGLKVGDPVSAFELSGVVNQREPRLFIRNVELSLDGTTWSNATLVMGLGEVARLPRSAVQVVTL